ncbi:cholesterol transport system auxiliary component [Marinobacter gudaonensis]|uniref:Cholesterol transport system auxiliary component n=1 Tax=Marinobacter gudaonensis TaxID=375760 RepID=A0A1I6G906_9GAMM|nr:ABC-type transport auxiliary lipoprotein family protein [Marinobacter gudaonensis]SFR38682.1 cholesterol transport system auxiliary component [Marinobacter gudaonensis]
MTTRFFGAIVITLGIATAAGCTVFPNPEPPRVMDLAWSNTERAPASGIPFVLRVDTPYASEPFNSTRILAKPSDWEFQSYPDVRWRDTVPMMLRDAMIVSLRRHAGFADVIAETSPAEANLTLVSELSAFHAEEPGGYPRVNLRLHAQVIDAGSRQSLCRQTFTVEQDAEGPAIEQVVQAFGDAGQSLTARMIDWLSGCGYPPAPETVRARQP